MRFGPPPRMTTFFLSEGFASFARVYGRVGGLDQIELPQTFDQAVGATVGERAQTFGENVGKFFAHFAKRNCGGTNAEFASGGDPARASPGRGLFLGFARAEQGNRWEAP